MAKRKKPLIILDCLGMVMNGDYQTEQQCSAVVVYGCVVTYSSPKVNRFLADLSREISKTLPKPSEQTRIQFYEQYDEKRIRVRPKRLH